MTKSRHLCNVKFKNISANTTNTVIFLQLTSSMTDSHCSSNEESTVWLSHSHVLATPILSYNDFTANQLYRQDCYGLKTKNKKD